MPKPAETRESLEADLKGARDLLEDAALLSRLPDKGKRIRDNIARLEERLAVLRSIGGVQAGPVQLRNAAPTAAPQADEVEAEPAVGQAAGRVGFDASAGPAVPGASGKKAGPAEAPTEAQLTEAEAVLAPWKVSRSNVADMRAPMLVQIELVNRTDASQAAKLLAALDLLSVTAFPETDPVQQAALMLKYMHIVPKPDAANKSTRQAHGLSSAESQKIIEDQRQRQQDDEREELLLMAARAAGPPVTHPSNDRTRASYRDMFK